MRCQYPNKHCGKGRTLKENGELHRFCAYHRSQANDAQRRWHSRHRAGCSVALTKDISVYAKSRRQAYREIARPYRRQRNMIKPEVSVMPVVYTPVSPPSVDDAHTFRCISDAAQATYGPHVNDADRLSAEDLALLDELMMGLGEAPVMTGHEIAMGQPVGGSSGWEWQLANIGYV
jgi:hypothetical protein